MEEVLDPTANKPSKVLHDAASWSVLIVLWVAFDPNWANE